MNKTQWISLVVVLSCFLLMGAWDAVVLHFWGRKSTVSYLMTMMSYYWPMGVFLLGSVCGHFFWPQCSFQDDAVIERRIVIKVDERGNILSVKDEVVQIRNE